MSSNHPSSNVVQGISLPTHTTGGVGAHQHTVGGTPVNQDLPGKLMWNAWNAVDTDHYNIVDESRWMVNVITLRFSGIKNGPAYKPLPFRHLHACYLDDENVAVVVVVNGKLVTIEDTAAMFPSDALISQLRLLADSIKK